MAELLDTYNYQTGEFIAAIDRDIVHRDALWHKTVHCWLYDKVGQVYFQMRQDEPNGNLYVTASGHLRAGESVEAGFTREIKEEIGLSLLASDAAESQVREYIVDRERPDGSLYRDRAWSNIFFYQYDGLMPTSSSILLNSPVSSRLMLLLHFSSFVAKSIPSTLFQFSPPRTAKTRPVLSWSRLAIFSFAQAKTLRQNTATFSRLLRV